jgi:uncharacterized protein YndB with AHSA1/START domain
MADKFEISRLFAAPIRRVWDAWTKPEQIALWLSPVGTKSEVLHFDFQPGGFLHSRVTGPDGSSSWAKNVYREIQEPNRLVYEQGFSNEAGEFVAAPFPMPWPLKLLTTVLLAEQKDGTRVTLYWEPLDATAEQRASFAQMIASMTGGWTGTFDQLDTFLGGPA